MNKMISNCFLVVLTVLLAVAFSGCGARQVSIKSDFYQPGIDPALFSNYKGKSIIVSEVTNKDEKTTAWAYKDQDRRLWYVHDVSLDTYMQKALGTAFTKIGMTVYTPSSSGQVVFFHFIPRVVKQQKEIKLPPKTNDVRISLLSVSNREVVFKTSLLRDDAMLYSGMMKTAIEPLPENKDKDGDLIVHSYRLMDKVAETILTDRDFSAAFFK